MGIRNQIIGLIRFSYPATEGFAASALGDDALQDMLYDPARLAKRFAFLETLTLPSLAAQTDPDFTCVILAGSTLPDEWKDRLRTQADRFPFLRFAFLDRMGPLAAAKRGFRRNVDGGVTHVTGFRLDDDDALGIDYIEKTRDRAARLIDGGFAETPACLAFTRGLYFDINSSDQPFHQFREAYAPSLACAMITSPDIPTCIYRYNHRRIATFIPTYLEPGGNEMFIRLQHDDNDSNRSAPPHAVPLSTRKGAKILRERFGIDPEAAARLMPTTPKDWQ
ncbi:Putative rhamnosyl transferase [Jannaschia faecimaris]|uniref:Putative rhamnosyl transferase n=1 Tax=Jannaschia faecimaris TaxID=1244108 RepID=A0A1H3ULM2_9RHOB|nr:glycosyltransferase [Jannaschia faecimaris]SDZ62609.1 Putative rhamnosyl transferase [Jannaschia faecimaris]